MDYSLDYFTRSMAGMPLYIKYLPYTIFPWMHEKIDGHFYNAPFN